MLHFRSFAVRTALCVLTLLALVPTAQAGIIINYSVDGAGPFNYQGDTSSIISFTGSATLIDGVLQALKIGDVVTTIGNSGSFSGSQLFNANRTLTINSFGGTLMQDLTNSISLIQDTISLTGGITTTINLGGGKFVDVTPIAYTRNFTSLGTTTDPINATFLLRTVPEPASLSLLAIGALGMFGASKRKQVKA